MKEFIKFPHTYHLLDIHGSLDRQDKLLSAEVRDQFYSQPVVVEEKVDGANVGFSLSEDGNIQVQNRGHFITDSSSLQFKHLNSWIRAHQDELFDLLYPHCILFGEWCYAVHSIYYDQLPDWFLAFDIYDLEQKRFLCRERRHEKLKDTGIYEVPFLGKRRIEPNNVIDFLNTTQSALHNGPMEGIYLRIEDNEQLLQRAKVVRPGFIQNIDQHWSKSQLRANKLSVRSI